MKSVQTVTRTGRTFHAHADVSNSSDHPGVLDAGVYHWVETLFADYEAANPGRYLTSHMFRKRAFTLAREAGIDMKQASIAYGCGADTLMKHSVAINDAEMSPDEN